MHRDDINWDDLRFLRVALSAGSLAGAARALGVEHTTVGRRLDALERALGAPLISRDASGVRATTIGGELAPLLDDLDRQIAALRALVAARRRHVRLATPSGMAPLFTARLAELGPDISLELVTGARPVDLQKGDADLALRIGPISDDNLVAKKLGEVGWALYASRDYLARAPTVNVDDLSGHDVIGFEETLARSPAGQWLHTRTRRANVVLRSREMVDIRDAAVAGLGLAVVSCWLGNAEPSLVRLTPDDVASRPISIVYRRDQRLSGAVRKVVAFVAEVIAATVSTMSGPPRTRREASSSPRASRTRRRTRRGSRGSDRTSP